MCPDRVLHTHEEFDLLDAAKLRLRLWVRLRWHTSRHRFRLQRTDTWLPLRAPVQRQSRLVDYAVESRYAEHIIMVAPGSSAFAQN